METKIDFLNWLDHEMSMKILMCLDDPSDLVRFSCVSNSSRDFVIKNGFCRQLCLRMFPQLANIVCVTECMDIGSSNVNELKKEHRAYALLARCLTQISVGDCMGGAICASSTERDPSEGIANTLRRDGRRHRVSYWSSKGQQDPTVPETLTYQLIDDLCVIAEINIQPFQVNSQSIYSQSIFSANAVRFRMGHRRSPFDKSSDDKFVWTYTSQEFPMAQENRLQNFKLPEPVLCIGGVLQIELLGRVQKDSITELFYICVSYVQILGKSLSPFGIEILKNSEKYVLKVLSYSQLDLQSRVSLSSFQNDAIWQPLARESEE